MCSEKECSHLFKTSLNSILLSCPYIKSFFFTGIEEWKIRVPSSSAFGMKIALSAHIRYNYSGPGSSKLLKNKVQEILASPFSTKYLCEGHKNCHFSWWWLNSPFIAAARASPLHTVSNVVDCRTEEWKLAVYYLVCMFWLCFGFGFWIEMGRQKKIPCLKDRKYKKWENVGQITV